MTDARPLLDWREDNDDGEEWHYWYGYRSGIPLAIAWEGNTTWLWKALSGTYETTNFGPGTQTCPTREAAQAAAEQAVHDWFQRLGARLEEGQ